MKFFYCILTLLVTAANVEIAVLADDFIEPDYGFRFEIDEQNWQHAPIPVSTLGEPLIVLIDGPQPKMLLDVFVRMMTEAPKTHESGLKSIQEKLARIGAANNNTKVDMNEITDVAEQQAISLRLSGPGNGIGLGAGSTPTVQHWTCFLREKDLIVFQVTAPEENFETAFENYEKLLKTVKIKERRPPKDSIRKYDSEEIGLTVNYPQGEWIRGGYELGDFIVPGYLLRLWSAKSDNRTTSDGVSGYATRLAMFLQFPGKKYEPQTLLDLSISGLTRGDVAKVIEQDVREIAGHSAMWLLVEGNSKTGSNLTSQGNVATRQLWIAIPRKHETTESIVVFLLNTPKADYEARLKEFNKMLESLKVQSND